MNDVKEIERLLLGVTLIGGWEVGIVFYFI